MSDPLSIRQCLFTAALAKLITRIGELDLQVKIQELNRDITTQREYMAKGVSKTMDSRHLDKLAADLILFKDGQIVTDNEAYRPLGMYWEGLGGRWGGRFGLEDKPSDVQELRMGWDPDHFEFRKSA